MGTVKVTNIEPIADNGTVTLGSSGDTIALTSGAKTSGFGKIGQVVEVTSNTEKSTTSSSFVATGITLNITPTTTTSKILLCLTAPMFINHSGAAHVVVTIYRGGVSSGTNIGANDFDLLNSYSSNNSDQLSTLSRQILDAPATTSQVSYEVALRRVTAGTGYISHNGDTCSLVAMEILD